MTSRVMSFVMGLGLCATTAAHAAQDWPPQVRAKLGSVLPQKLEQSVAAETFDVLVYLKDRADLSEAERMPTAEAKRRFVVKTLKRHAKATQKPLIRFLEKRNVSYRRFFVANMIKVEDASRALIRDLAERADVERLRGDFPQKVLEPRTDLGAEATSKPSGIEESISQTGADQVWQELGVKGEGIVIAGQDTGIDWGHPALKDAYRGWNDGSASHDYNWYDAIKEPIDGGSDCDYDSAAPCDDHGHGTHTLGTTLGDDGEGNRIGMAPAATWIGCRNMDAGVGRPSTYIDCFEFFLAPWPRGGESLEDGDPSRGADVINNSWGCPASENCEGDEFIPVLQSLKEAGIMVVAAAGNAGSSCETISDGPAHHSELTLAVGAHDHRDGSIASFSSRGPSAFDGQVGPDLTAPGVSIRSSIPGGDFSSFFWSGTSMASPHVAGAVALLWAADPSLKGDVDATRDVLVTSAVGQTSSQSCGGTSGDEIPNNTFGHGHLNIYDAVASRLQ